MDFVDAHWRVQRLVVRAFGQPRGVVPAKRAHVPHYRRGPRAQLSRECVRIRLLEPMSTVSWSDRVLVERALADAGYESLPDARHAATLQPRATRLPAVKVADDRYGFRIGRPHSEQRTEHAVSIDWMGAQLPVQMGVRALVEQMQVIIRQKRRCSRGLI